MTLPPDPMVGTLIADKYKITKKLGEGGMGTVYQAMQQPIDRLVAVKVLLGKLAQDEVAVKRFELEARAVSKMQHPNTVTIFDYGKTNDDRLYIVMEFLKGKTLSDALRATGVGLDEKRGITIMRQVCSSLGDAHAAGIIHRDLKPDNIFLTELGGSKDWVKVLDFGVAKMADTEGASTLTQTGMIFGTPKYMSPEQAEGKPIDHRADIYAIGVVMYEVFTGRPPFLADTPVALLLKHISEAPKPFRVLRPDLTLSPEIEAVVMKALAKQPEQRYANVEQLSADLEACLGFIRNTGMQRVIEGSTQQSGIPSRATPTEVNPNQPPPHDLSLRSPNALPSGLSLGLMDVRRAPTEPAPSTPQSGPTGVAPSLHYAPDPKTMGFGSGLTPSPTAATGPLQTGLGVDTIGGQVGDLDLSRGLRAPEKKSPALAIGGMAVLVLGLVGFLMMRGEEEVASRPLVEPSPSPTVAVTPTPTPEPTPTVTAEPSPSPSVVASASPTPVARPTIKPAPTAAPKAERVTLSFSSTPPNAVVALRSGEQLGRTPFKTEFVKDADLVSVVFELAGYEPVTQTFTLSVDRNVSVVLRAEQAAPPPPSPTAKPTPTATPVATARPTPSPSPSSTSINDRVDELK